MVKARTRTILASHWENLCFNVIEACLSEKSSNVVRLSCSSPPSGSTLAAAPLQRVVHGPNDLIHGDLVSAVGGASAANRDISVPEGDIHHGEYLINRNRSVAVAVTETRPRRCGRCGSEGWGRSKDFLERKHALAVGSGVHEIRVGWIDRQRDDRRPQTAVQPVPRLATVGALVNAAATGINRGGNRSIGGHGGDEVTL